MEVKFSEIVSHLPSPITTANKEPLYNFGMWILAKDGT